MQEWLNWLVSKTSVFLLKHRGFESLSLRQFTAVDLITKMPFIVDVSRGLIPALLVVETIANFIKIKVQKKTYHIITIQILYNSLMAF